MNDWLSAAFAKDPFPSSDFDIAGLDDEIRADRRCEELLRLFLRDLLEEEGLLPEEAGAHARGADYFLRDFVIADRRENIFALRPGRVRQFAGNWYIVKNLEPNLHELTSILQGVVAFYDFCLKVGKVSAPLAEAVRAESAELSWYGERIESFWAIEGDGYLAWERACSLRD